jgi:ElaB/YqjD/DUF883 family membrane-anchored ribosome-binding protein
MSAKSAGDAAGVRNGDEKIIEALKLLEQAAAEKKDQLKEIINEKFSHLKKELSDVDSAVHRAHEEAKERLAEAAHRARELGEEKAREVAQHVDQSAHQHPWLYVAGGALGGLLLGYILGRKD